MKRILENWNKFLLNESKMLQPGPNGWDLYATLVAKAYMAAPAYEPAAAAQFALLGGFIDKMFKRISANVDIQFVDYHPYDTAQEVRDDVFNNGVMKVATIDFKPEQHVFDTETNTKFRAVHDYMSHVQAIGSRGTEFSLVGEITAYNAHLSTVSPKAWGALFTEIIGQVCTYYALDEEFGPQKICLLPEFDYEYIGALTPEGEKKFGFRLDRDKKILVPIGDSTPE